MVTFKLSGHTQSTVRPEGCGIMVIGPTVEVSPFLITRKYASSVGLFGTVQLAIPCPVIGFNVRLFQELPPLEENCQLSPLVSPSQRTTIAPGVND